MTRERKRQSLRTIFPAMLNDFERTLLTQLSVESGLSRSAVVRTLILKEMAQRQLTPAPRRPAEAVKGRVGEPVQ